jgi:hypothetical protein
MGEEQSAFDDWDALCSCAPDDENGLFVAHVWIDRIYWLQL